MEDIKQQREAGQAPWPCGCVRMMAEVIGDYRDENGVGAWAESRVNHLDPLHRFVSLFTDKMGTVREYGETAYDHAQIEAMSRLKWR